MKILERRINYAHWKDLNIVYSYNVDKGVKLVRSVKIVISGKTISSLSDKEVSILLQKLSLVARGKDPIPGKTPGASVLDSIT
jgi:hypothetical protein